MKSTFGNALLVFAGGASYGFIVPVIKAATANGILPYDFLPLQYLFAFIACLVFTLAKQRSWGSAKSLPRLALLGVFTGCTSLCYYVSVSLLPSAVALTLLFQYVWVNILIDCVSAHRLPERSTVIAVAIVMMGTAMAAGLFEDSFGMLDPIGIAAGMGSAVFYALFLFFSGRIGIGHPPSVRATMLALGGLAVTSLVNPACYTSSFLDVGVWPYAIGMSVIGVILPTTLINYASPNLSAGMVSVMASSELPVGILAAWAIVGDVPSPLALIGAALVLAGIVFKQLPALMRVHAVE